MPNPRKSRTTLSSAMKIRDGFVSGYAAAIHDEGGDFNVDRRNQAFIKAHPLEAATVLAAFDGDILGTADE